MDEVLVVLRNLVWASSPHHSKFTSAMSWPSEEPDMTISNDSDLTCLKQVGHIVANTLEAMGKALEPGMTTSELDRIGRKLLEAAGARPAPELTYAFPGATCISVNKEIAHGIPGPDELSVATWSTSTFQPRRTDFLRIREPRSPFRP
jgi:hypothetical protein